jgi:hypothetical protein
MPSFTSPFDVLVEHLRGANLKFHADYESKSAGLTMCGEAAIYNCRFRISHDDEILQIDVTFPVQARAAAMRTLAAEMITRANHRLPIGHLEMDMADGEISFHVGHVIGEAGLDDYIVNRLFGTALTSSDRYFTALMRLMYGGHTPEDAVYVADLDSHCERVSKDETMPSVKPSSKKSVRAARKKKQRTTSDAPTPDLLNPPASEGTDPTTKDRPS